MLVVTHRRVVEDANELAHFHGRTITVRKQEAELHEVTQGIIPERSGRTMRPPASVTMNTSTLLEAVLRGINFVRQVAGKLRLPVRDLARAFKIPIVGQRVPAQLAKELAVLSKLRHSILQFINLHHDHTTIEEPLL